MARFSPVFRAGGGGHLRKGPDRRGDVSTGDERFARRPLARHRWQSDRHLAAPDGAGCADRRHSGRGSGAGVQVPSARGAGARTTPTARQEGHGERAAPRGRVPGRRPKKLLLRSPSLPRDGR